MEVLRSADEYYYVCAGSHDGTKWFSYENAPTNQSCSYWNIASSTIKGKLVLSPNTTYNYDIIYDNGSFSAVVGDYSYSTTYSGVLGVGPFTFFVADHPSYVKLYYLKLYSANTSKPTCDFIPAIRNSDNAICLYDRVSRQFYTNSGSGAFIGGAETGGIIYE